MSLIVQLSHIPRYGILHDSQSHWGLGVRANPVRALFFLPLHQGISLRGPASRSSPMAPDLFPLYLCVHAAVRTPPPRGGGAMHSRTGHLQRTGTKVARNQSGNIGSTADRTAKRGPPVCGVTLTRPLGYTQKILARRRHKLRVSFWKQGIDGQCFRETLVSIQKTPRAGGGG